MVRSSLNKPPILGQANAKAFCERRDAVLGRENLEKGRPNLFLGRCNNHERRSLLSWAQWMSRTGYAYCALLVVRGEETRIRQGARTYVCSCVRVFSPGSSGSVRHTKLQALGGLCVLRKVRLLRLTATQFGGMPIVQKASL